MSAVAIVLFTFGMVLFTLDTVFLYERRCYCVVYLGYGIVYLGYGVPTGTLVCECCLPWIRCSCMSAVAFVLFTLGMVSFTLDTVFLQKRLCVSVVYLGYGVPALARERLF